jgi:ammonia channel protein AmtB
MNTLTFVLLSIFLVIFFGGFGYFAGQAFRDKGVIGSIIGLILSVAIILVIYYKKVKENYEKIKEKKN